MTKNQTAPIKVEGGNENDGTMGNSFTERFQSLKVEKMLTIGEMANILHLPPRTIENWLYYNHVPEPAKQEWIFTVFESEDAPPSKEFKSWMRRHHGLTWDASKRRWKLRLTIETGKKTVGMRRSAHIAVTDADTAIMVRNLTLNVLRQLGLEVIQRIQKRRTI